MKTTYVYDKLSQLTRVNDPSDTTSGSTGTTWTYEYDRGGNILNKKRYAYTTGTVGSVLQTITYTYDTTWKDKLAKYNGTAITYDAIGNPLTDGTWTYTWEKGRQLKQMTKSGTTATFLYNADGLRIRKTVGSTVTNYTLHGKNIVHMTQGSNTLHFWYDAQNRPAIVQFNGTKYGYIHNLQGDVIGLIDSNGTEVVKYVYDAWGKILSTTGSLASTLGAVQPFRYRSYVYDQETGLYYLRSRYYNPVWKRFLNADFTLTKNLFCYCGNKPSIFSDNAGCSGVPAFCKEGDVLEITFYGNNEFLQHYSELTNNAPIYITVHTPGYKVDNIDFSSKATYIPSAYERAQSINDFVSDSTDQISLMIGYLGSMVLGYALGTYLHPEEIAESVNAVLNIATTGVSHLFKHSISEGEAGHYHYEYTMTIWGSGVIYQKDQYIINLCEMACHETSIFFTSVTGYLANPNIFK